MPGLIKDVPTPAAGQKADDPGVHGVGRQHQGVRGEEDTLRGSWKPARRGRESGAVAEAGLLVLSTELPGLLLVAGGPGAGLLGLMALGAGNDNGAFLLHGLGRTSTAPARAPTAAASRGATSSTSGAHNDLLARSSTAAAGSSSHAVA